MKLSISFIILILIFSFSQSGSAGDGVQPAAIHTSVVLQSWKIDGMDDDISEGTLPIEILIPINHKFNLQVSHSPAISRIDTIRLVGLSDTWLRSTYSFYDDKLMVSGGIGLPTGKRDLSQDETMLATLLGNNVFKFQLPVFGQGFTASGGIMYAHPISERFVIGGGANFVLQGKYKYLKYDFDPGEQIGLNLGFDYNHSPAAKFNFDFLYNYYMKDRIEKVEHRVTPQIGAKARFIYNDNKKVIFIAGSLRLKGKSETTLGTTIIPDSTNSNITQMELTAFYRIELNEKLSFDVLFDGRSYIENEYRIGQADIFTLGLRNNIQLRPNIHLNISLKQSFGDGYFSEKIVKFSGREFQIGSTIEL